MASLTEIFNMALIEIGSDIVIEPAEPGNDPARDLSVRYPNVRDAVLRAHPWNFAVRRLGIAKDTAAPAWGELNQFTLPADPYCLRALREQNPKVKFTVEGRKLLTTASPPFNLLYIARIDDTAQYDPLFVEALAARLGSAVAYRLTQSRSIQDDAWKRYKEKLAEAREIDGQEGTAEDFADSTFLLSRQ